MLHDSNYIALCFMHFFVVGYALIKKIWKHKNLKMNVEFGKLQD